MEKTMKVTGKGKLALSPDRMQLLITLTDTNKEYQETIKQSSKQTEQLRKALEELGFKKSDLKTQLFNVDTEYENYHDKNNEWKRRFVGYKFVHNMKLEFDFNNELLGKVLYVLAHCEMKIEFRICYTVKDTETAKNTLLAKAVEDSKTKAKVLAMAAGVNLKEIIRIDYSWGEINFVSNPVDRVMESCMTLQAQGNRCYDLDVEPEEIEVSDIVTVVWRID